MVWHTELAVFRRAACSGALCIPDGGLRGVIMRKLLFISDLDGTLLNEDKQVPQKNIDAIRRFTQAGGLFTIATGRSEETCRVAADRLPINAPAILYNGALVYDLKESRVLAQRQLEAALFRPVIRDIMERFPDICIEVLVCGDLLLPNPQAVMDPFILREKQSYHFADLSRLPEHWLKFMLSAPPQRLQEAEEYLSGCELPPCCRFYSSEYYYEFLPVDCTKGHAAQKLADMLGVAREDTAVIGDHLNDIELLQWAGTAFAPSSAHPAAQKNAKVLAHSNNEGAVADAIEEFAREKAGSL